MQHYQRKLHAYTFFSGASCCRHPRFSNSWLNWRQSRSRSLTHCVVETLEASYHSDAVTVGDVRRYHARRIRPLSVSKYDTAAIPSDPLDLLTTLDTPCQITRGTRDWRWTARCSHCHCLCTFQNAVCDLYLRPLKVLGATVRTFNSISETSLHCFVPRSSPLSPTQER